MNNHPQQQERNVAIKETFGPIRHKLMVNYFTTNRKKRAEKKVQQEKHRTREESKGFFRRQH